MMRVQLVLEREVGELFAAQLSETDPETVVWTPETGATLTVEAYAPSRAAARRIRARWRDVAQALGYSPVAPSMTPLPEADWATAWRSHFHLERVGDRLVICPDWESYVARPGDWVIRIDPGMSFGTGQHATTRACLTFMERCLGATMAGRRFLDLGCGSGILSIAALRMGFEVVTAIDSDPTAVKDALANAGRNALAGRLDCRTADLARFRASRRYDVVAANLLADLLVTHAARVAATVAAGGSLLLAGILREQYAAVGAAYAALGFEAVESLTEGDWRSGWWRKPVDAP